MVLTIASDTDDLPKPEMVWNTRRHIGWEGV